MTPLLLSQESKTGLHQRKDTFFLLLGSYCMFSYIDWPSPLMKWLPLSVALPTVTVGSVVGLRKSALVLTEPWCPGGVRSAAVLSPAISYQSSLETRPASEPAQDGFSEPSLPAAACLLRFSQQRRAVATLDTAGKSLKHNEKNGWLAPLLSSGTTGCPPSPPPLPPILLSPTDAHVLNTCSAPAPLFIFIRRRGARDGEASAVTRRSRRAGRDADRPAAALCGAALRACDSTLRRARPLTDSERVN